MGRCGAIGALLALAVAVGCGSSDRPDTVARESGAADTTGGSANAGAAGESGETSTDGPFGGNTTATSTGSGGSGGAGGSSAGGTGGSSSEGGPSVEVVSPADESEPDEVYNETLPVACRVEESEAEDSAPPDPASITLELIDDGEVVDTRVGEEGDDAGVYEAVFPVQNLPSGAITVRCNAADTLMNPRTSSDEVTTYLDHGPLVTIISPEEEAPESPQGAVVFEYEVLPDELVENDAGAAIEEVTLTVRGVEFEITELEDEEGVYRTTVDFNDTSLFAEVPSGSVTVSLNAVNARGIVHNEQYSFVLDGVGPTLSIESPGDGAVVGNTVNLRMRMTDALSGVNIDSLEVRLNTVPHVYDANSGVWTQNGDEMVFQFESSQVNSQTQITVNARVEDNAGNPGSASTLYYIDQYPPIVSMDPPNFRRLNESNGQCSYSFDPLGDAIGHGGSVVDHGLFRAVVWDITNGAVGANVLYLAGTNPSSVKLFLKPYDPEQPLLVDTTGDGVCDNVADEQNLAFQDLTALEPEGTPLFGPADEDPFPEVPPTDGCLFPTSSNSPDSLCDDESDLYTTVNHQSGADVSVIYAILPTNDIECTGRTWELPAVLPNYDGWVCMAVRALDRVGNRGISKPIAVCLDSVLAGTPACMAELDSPPNCASGCSDPLTFPETGVIYER